MIKCLTTLDRGIRFFVKGWVCETKMNIVHSRAY